MRYFTCPLCAKKIIFPLMSKHYKKEHQDIWKTFTDSHHTNFSEFLYVYFFYVIDEVCKYCSSQTEFLSIVRGYDSICQRCKIRTIVQKCPECSTHIAFPQLIYHLVKHHLYDLSNTLYEAFSKDLSQPKDCIVCGSATKVYSFGFCPLCDKCSRISSLLKITNILDAWKAYFGSKSKAKSLAWRLGDQEVDRRQKLFETFLDTFVCNGYPYFFYVNYLREFINMVHGSEACNLDQDFSLRYKGEDYNFDIIVPKFKLLIDFIPWICCDSVAAPNSEVWSNMTLEQYTRFRKEMYEEAKSLGYRVLEVQEPFFLEYPERTLILIEHPEKF